MCASVCVLVVLGLDIVGSLWMALIVVDGVYDGAWVLTCGGGVDVSIVRAWARLRGVW